MTVKELIESRARTYKEKTYLYFDELEVSYEQMDNISNSIANSLLSMGIAKGDKVALLLPNCPEFIYCFFGIMKIGAVLVPINSLLKADEIKYILDNSDARALFTVSKFADAIGTIRRDCPKLESAFLIDGQQEGFISFEKMMEGSSDPVSEGPSEDDEAGIIYTSGTTGRPKGAVLTHRNYIANAGQLVHAGRMTDKDRFLCILPLFHVNAQLVTTLSPMTAGGSMILLRGFSPREFLPALSKYEATAFSGVPTVYAILNNMPDAEQYDLSSLRFCICGAAPMPVEVFNTFEKKYNATILEGYGLSEATCASSINPIDGTRKIGSIGLPFKGQEMKIVDDRGNEMAAGEVGEIIVKGDVLMKGYYKNPEATKNTLRDGWLYTGDLGYKDKDGYYFIVGRKKEMIIRGGENIYPKEIEEVLYKNPKVQEASVCGVPDKIWGEEVVAFLVLQEGEKFPPEEVIEYCKQHIADYKCPRRVEYLKQFPKTATGKIQKNRIVEDYIKRDAT